MLWSVKLSRLQKLNVREIDMQKSLMFSPLSQVHEFLLCELWLLKGIPTPVILLPRLVGLSCILEIPK